MKILIFAILLSGCASIHNGNFASPESQGSAAHSSASGLVISGEENVALSSRYIGAMDFTFENLTDHWIHIKGVRLDFGSQDANASAHVPVGADLVAWAHAAEQRKDVRDYNTALVLGSVMLVGVAVAGNHGNSAVAQAGAVTALAASGALLVTAVRSDLDRVQLAKVVPPDHLLADDFVIPPGLHAKKWIAIFTEWGSPKIKNVKVTYTIEGGKTESAVPRLIVGSQIGRCKRAPGPEYAEINIIESGFMLIRY